MLTRRDGSKAAAKKSTATEIWEKNLSLRFRIATVSLGCIS
jgi:hypothetical protein